LNHNQKFMIKKTIIISPYCFPGLKEIPDFIKSNIPNLNQKKMNQKEILKIISEEFNVTVDDIISNSRKKETVNARYVYFAAMKLKYNKSLKDIGDSSVIRDHTTVIHGLKHFKYRYDNENNFKDIATKIFHILGIQYDGRKLTTSK